MGREIGFLDAHLLASAHVSRTPLWSSDKTLQSAAVELKVAYEYR